MDGSASGRSTTPQGGGGGQPSGVSPSPTGGGLPGGRGATPRGSSSSTSSGGQGVSPSVSGSGSGTESRTALDGQGGISSSASHYQSLGVTPTPRSLSLASISSEGSTESHLVEQEDIVALCASVRAFKEALGKLRRIFSPDRDKNETLKVAAHERLGEVLRILRTILEKYSPIQHNELLSAASQLITNVNGFDYEDEEADHTAFLESIDHLALAFSSRVSDYLMGDIDTSSTPLNCSSAASSRTKSCENILCSDAESMGGGGGDRLVGAFPPMGVGSALQHDVSTGSILQREPDFLSNQEIDDLLHSHEKGVELALHRAKVWSKYAKDVLTYVEKRCQLGMDYARNQIKLANAIRPMIKDESFLPFQSIFCTALDHDLESCSSLSTTCNLILTSKFVEPLVAGRNEHEQIRKGIKEKWHKQLKRLTEAINSLKKARMIYIQRNQDLQKVSDSLQQKGGTPEQTEKLEKKKEELSLKVKEATASYQSAVTEANDQHATLLKVKSQVLQGTRELMLQADQVMKAVTLNYFQLIHGVLVPQPIQFQTLYESSRLYEPGTQYMEFVKRVGGTGGSEAPLHTFEFEPFSTTGGNSTATEEVQAGLSRLTSQTGSDTDSLGSSRSTKSADASPSSSPLPPGRRVIAQNFSSGEELEGDAEDGVYIPRRSLMSKAADTHTFRKLKTPSRCRECDSYVYFHGYECNECGLGCHKKCLETIAIQCGHKRLPRKLTTFGVDLQQHLQETGALVPHLVIKCLTEIDSRGTDVKGIYRVSGLKSRVEKLCQAFENGAQLVDLTDQHPNVIANVLKLYLRQLPEPLLTFRLYPEFVRIAKEFPTNGAQDSAGAIHMLRDLVKHLPSHHLFCLRALMLHLFRVSSHSDINNMPPSNLGIVFGPTLLRTAEGSASLSSLVDTVHQTRAIELLVQYATEIFGHLDHPIVEGQLQLPSQLAVIGQQLITSVSTSAAQPLPSAVPGAAAAKTSKQEEQRKGTPSSRQGSLHSGSNGALHPTGSVKQGATDPHPAPPVPYTRRKKELVDVDHEDEWDWSSDEPFGSVKSAPEPHTHPPASQAATPSGATIVKTSLKDYVGLEMAALMEQRAESLEIPGHSKLKKSLSDTPPVTRSSTASAIATAVSTNPSPTTHDQLAKSNVDSSGIVKIPVTFEHSKRDKAVPSSLPQARVQDLAGMHKKSQKSSHQDASQIQHVPIQQQQQDSPHPMQQKQVQVQLQQQQATQQKAKIIEISQPQVHHQVPQNQAIIQQQKIPAKPSTQQQQQQHQQPQQQVQHQQLQQQQQQSSQIQQSLPHQIRTQQQSHQVPSASQTKQQHPQLIQQQHQQLTQQHHPQLTQQHHTQLTQQQPQQLTQQHQQIIQQQHQQQHPPVCYESMGLMKRLTHQASLEESGIQKKRGQDKLARQPVSFEEHRRLSQQLRGREEALGTPSLPLSDKRNQKIEYETIPVIRQVMKEEKLVEDPRIGHKAEEVVPRPITIVSSREKETVKKDTHAPNGSQIKQADSGDAIATAMTESSKSLAQTITSISPPMNKQTITISPEAPPTKSASPSGTAPKTAMGTIAGVSITGIGVKVLEGDLGMSKGDGQEAKTLKGGKADSPVTQRTPIAEKIHIIPTVATIPSQKQSSAADTPKKGQSYTRIAEIKSSSRSVGDSSDSQHSLYCASPDASLENLASSDSSSLDFHTEGSQSSLDVMEDSSRVAASQFYSTDPATFDHSSSGASSFSSICSSSKNSSNSSINSSGLGGSNSADGGVQETPSKHSLSGPYVSPYMTERSRLLALGPSLVLTRSTFAQYDSKRTITTTLSHSPKSSSNADHKVRIQVPATSSENEELATARKRQHNQDSLLGGSKAPPPVTQITPSATPPTALNETSDFVKVEKQLEYDI